MPKVNFPQTPTARRITPVIWKIWSRKREAWLDFIRVTYDLTDNRIFFQKYRISDQRKNAKVFIRLIRKKQCHKSKLQNSKSAVYTDNFTDKSIQYTQGIIKLFLSTTKKYCMHLFYFIFILSSGLNLKYENVLN